MGTSGRDRRVRSPIGKRRTPGQRAEDSDEEQHGGPVVVEDTDDNLQREPASGSAGPAGEVDANGGEEVEYTRRQQVSPTRKRGRLPVPGRTKLKGRTSLAEILAASPVKLHRFSSRMAFAVRILQQEHVLAKVRSGSWSHVEVPATGAAKLAGRLQLSQLSTWTCLAARDFLFEP